MEEEPLLAAEGLVAVCLLLVETPSQILVLAAAAQEPRSPTLPPLAAVAAVAAVMSRPS